jgi:2,4-dienoyl-CoA reductase-like NADH-dependent reductase (Old Yellow Enzyme family)
MQDRPTKTTPDLFIPIEIGPLKLPNRIVMAPSTRSRAAAGNVPTVLNALYYAQRGSAPFVRTGRAQTGSNLTPLGCSVGIWGLRVGAWLYNSQ